MTSTPEFDAEASDAPEVAAAETDAVIESITVTDVETVAPVVSDDADAAPASDGADAAPVDAEPTSSIEPVDPDPRLFEAYDLARAALAEVTPATSIGDPAGYAIEDGGVVSLRFANRLAGYPGWYWTVSVAVVEGAEPTVLEVELLPGDGALLAPEWLPWAERLAEYQAAQAAAAAEDDDADEDVDDADDDEDAADFESDGSPILHAGDVDGVDIDELDDEADEEDSEEDDDSDDDDDADEDDSDDEEELREY
ncbi:DUF3027 domain-containing protein [Microbacterium dauci]|uniref:DUF3027 domain-containing protein n=1 Tax=Microbacterium dauci TaxID=3048008 RepID=UPI003D2F5E66